jgi:hypothetical protein
MARKRFTVPKDDQDCHVYLSECVYWPELRLTFRPISNKALASYQRESERAKAHTVAHQEAIRHRLIAKQVTSWTIQDDREADDDTPEDHVFETMPITVEGIEALHPMLIRKLEAIVLSLDYGDEDPLAGEPERFGAADKEALLGN